MLNIPSQMENGKVLVPGLCEQCVELVQSSLSAWKQVDRSAASLSTVAEHTAESTADLFIAVLDALPEKATARKWHHSEPYVNEYGVTQYKQVYVPVEEVLRGQTIEQLAEQGTTSCMHLVGHSLPAL